MKRHINNVTNHVRPADQLKSNPIFSAKLLVRFIFGNAITSKKITAPIGININPYSATKSSSFITRAGKHAAIDVTNPVKSVTFQRFQFGVTD
jgi:hypothetical protein